MLDLQQLSGDIYEVKLLDGKVYHLKRPTQQLFTSLLDLEKIANGKDTQRLMATVMGLFVRVLNRNTDGVEFTEEQISDDYDFMLAMAVLTDYLQFYSKEINEKVDFPITQ